MNQIMQPESRMCLDGYRSALVNFDLLRWRGVITGVTGTLIESQGPAAPIGSFCEIKTAGGRTIRTQVAGFRHGKVLSIPLEEINGLEAGDPIFARSDDAQVSVSPALLGRVLDGFGKPMVVIE